MTMNQAECAARQKTAREAEGPPKTDAPPPAPPPGEAASRETALIAAVLRIGASLDLETVLSEVVENARVLTGAEYGVIATVDENGDPRDFVTSGFTEEGFRAMEAWPDGLRLFGHLRGLVTADARRIAQVRVRTIIDDTFFTFSGGNRLVA